jgi:hypothetical protein
MVNFMSNWLDWFNEWLFNDSPPLPKCLFCNRSIELTNPSFFCNENCEEQYHNKLINHKCLYKDELVVLKGQGCLCYECKIKSCPFNKNGKY